MAEEDCCVYKESDKAFTYNSERMSLTLCVILCIGAVFCSEPPLENTDHAKYEGQSVLSVRLENAEQVALMRELQDDDSLMLDFFHAPALKRETGFLVPPSSMKTVMQKLETAKIKSQTVTTNFREMLDKSLKSSRDSSMRRAGKFDPFAFTQDYLRYDEINNILYRLLEEFPHMMTFSSIGQSMENRELIQIHISSDFNNPKPAVWVECLTHAREWISGAVCLYTIDRLVRQNDMEAFQMLQKFDWYFIPVANPDGYEYSHTTDRMWRKNRRRVSNRCYGVDLNRNWGAAFGGAGTSSSCNDETYKGDHALSEPETLHLRNAIKATQTKQGVVAFLAIHSFGQMILVPYGYTNQHAPPDQDILRYAAEKAADALYVPYGTYFYVGTSGELLYIAGGCSDDHFKEQEGIKYSYTYELRPEGPPYFLLGKEEIAPSQLETFASFHELAMVMVF